MALSGRAAYRMGFYTCNRCRSCTRAEAAGGMEVCPSYHHWGFFSHSGGGRVYAARGVFEGKVPRTVESARTVYECLLCGACEATCPEGIETLPLLVDLRSEFVEREAVPPAVAKLLDREWRRAGRAGATLARALRSSLLDLPGARPWVVVASFGGPEIPALRRILIHTGHGRIAGVAVGVDAGGVALELGDRTLWRAQSGRVLGEVERIGAKGILALDPLSAWSLKRMQGENGSSLEVLTLPQFLLRLFESRRPRFRRGPRVGVTYHDPCRLGRGLGVVDEPREILKRLPGVDLVEMPRHGRFALCCGAGGCAHEVNPALERETREERRREARSTGAQILVTACPRCSDTLGGGGRSGRGLPVRGLAAFVASRLAP